LGLNVKKAGIRINGLSDTRRKNEKEFRNCGESLMLIDDSFNKQFSYGLEIAAACR